MMITENMPLVCILMPVYNSDLTLKTAIQSIINQTFTNWVCVIVNDGSTDKTKEILNNMNDTRFRIINLKKNMGRGYARQVCLDNSIGEYIAFLDADDFYHPNKIQLQVDLFQNNMNVSLVYCGLVSFDNKLIPQRMRGVKYADSVIKYMPNDCILFTPATVLIKREKAVTIKYCTSLNAAEDIDYFSRYLKNESYVGINYILYYYREDPKAYFNYQPQQNFGRATGRRVPGFFSGQCRALLCFLLRLLPARSLYPPLRYLYRKGYPD